MKTYLKFLTAITVGTWLTGVVSAAPAIPSAVWQVELGESERLELVWIAACGIWVGRYEVTNGQFQRYDMAHKASPYFNNKLAASRQPVVNVSWNDAVNFASWLNRNFKSQLPEGYIFRLPTECEWEIYASAGQRRRYPWGNQWPPPGNLNYRGEEGMGLLYRLFENKNYIPGHNDGFIASAPVEQSGWNEWGLYGTAGNVWEWCADWLDGERRYRVIRGGGWNNFEEDYLRLNHRAFARPEQKNSMTGFRLVLAPIGE